MSVDLDLRDRLEDRRERLFDAIASAEPDGALDVVADDDLDPDLVRYQIERDRALSWEYADPDAEPRELRIAKDDPLDGALGTVDVRDLKPQRRHEALLDIFDELAAEEGFVLVNDHDPKPLYHELKSMHGEVVDWEYRSRGEDAWRVAVRKTDDSAADAPDTDSQDVHTRFDVREIPKAERHPTIHHRYGMIPEGGTMELVAPHEPRPLRREFDQRYGDSFDWRVVESEPGRCRVRVTKGAESASDAESSAGADPASAGAGDGAAESDADAEVEVVRELDVRDRPPAQRHEAIFDAYADLDGGEGFVLVNDHDPKPLYHQFKAESGPAFRWEYRQREPGEFRVLVGKAEAAADGPAVDESTGGTTEAPF